MASKRSPSTPALTEGEKNILSTAKQLYLNNEYSDMKIICGDKVFPAHRIILCVSSEYFRGACSGNFTEASGEIQLHDQPPVLIEMMLEFLYKGSYTVPEFGLLTALEPPAKRPKTTGEGKDKSCSTAMTGKLPGCVHLRMYGLADYFMIDSLKKMAKRHFLENLDDYQSWPPSENIHPVIEEIYSAHGNYEEFKTPLAKKIAQRFTEKQLAGLKEPLRSDISPLKSKLPQFAIDLCEELMSELIRHR